MYWVGAADPRTFRTLAPERAHNSRSRSVDRDRHVSRELSQRRTRSLRDDRRQYTRLYISHVTRISRSLLPIPFRSSNTQHKFRRGRLESSPLPFASSPLSSPHRERCDRNRGISRSRGSLAGTRGSARATRVRTRRARASERASGRDNESKRE